MSNPYIELIELMRKHGSAVNSPSIMLGEVVQVTPKVIIKLAGIQIDKDNFLMAEHINNLSNGDRLAIMPTFDRQTFIILARVVSS
jgi:hypothetical protein